MKKIALLLISSLMLSACASLQPRVEKVSLQSYEQGCSLRGVQKGMTGEQAQAACRCHVEKAIALTSTETFLEKVELIGRADNSQKQTPAFKEAVELMKSTFTECRQELGLL